MRVQITAAAPWQPILKELARRLASKGFASRETFNLQLARRALRRSDVVECPHHGGELCTCQYLVLRVGRAGQNASAIVLHGNERTTKVALISPAGEKPDEALATEICESVRHWRQQLNSIRAGGAPGAGSRTTGPLGAPAGRGGG